MGVVVRRRTTAITPACWQTYSHRPQRERASPQPALPLGLPEAGLLGRASQWRSPAHRSCNRRDAALEVSVPSRLPALRHRSFLVPAVPTILTELAIQTLRFHQLSMAPSLGDPTIR